MGVATHIVGAGAGVSEVGESVGQQYWYTMYVPMDAPTSDTNGPAGVYAVEVYAPKLTDYGVPQSVQYTYTLIEPPLPPQLQDVPEPSWAVIVALCMIVLYLLHDEERGGDGDDD